jgi:hypothetical protein
MRTYASHTVPMTKTPPQRPEGALIEAARLRQSPRKSGRKAAEMAGISEGRWRHIVKGYQTVKAGMYVEITAPADTLARMAWAVDVTAEELRDVGRGDAADFLENALGVGKDPIPTEIRAIDADDYRGFELAIEGTPPELRAFALKLALEAIESVKRSADQLPSKGSGENEV